MNRESTLHELLALSPAERILLAQDLWDSVEHEQVAWEPSPEWKAELERRINLYHQNPRAGSTWEEVKARIIRSA